MILLDTDHLSVFADGRDRLTDNAHLHAARPTVSSGSRVGVSSVFRPEE
jgi:hypothetical protein